MPGSDSGLNRYARREPSIDAIMDTKRVASANDAASQRGLAKGIMGADIRSRYVFFGIAIPGFKAPGSR